MLTHGRGNTEFNHLFPQPHVLLVDDDPLILEGLLRLLEGRGYDIVTAQGGREALVAIGRQQFDIILLDLAMPDVDGADVLAFLNEREVDTPVIVVSGNASIDAAIEALRGGATDFVRKPYEPEELLRRIDHTLARRRLEKENGLILQRLQQSEKWHRFLVNSSPDLIYTLDAEGRFTFLNDRVGDLLGWSKEELLGQPYTVLIHEEDLAEAAHIFNERRTNARQHKQIELRLKCNPGQRRPRAMNVRYRTFELKATGMYEDSGNRFETRFIGSYGVAKDISERKQAEEMIHYQTYHDLLTGLPNRALFRDHLGLALAQCKRNGQSLAVLILDLDHFKVINDSLGHGSGDELLLNVGARLRQCLREGDTLARLGGDEFAVLLPALPMRKDIEHIARKIIDALSRPMQIRDQEVYVSVSIGACSSPDYGDMVDTLIRQAEIAMYQAKTQGRSRLQFWQAGMQAPYSARIQLEAELRRALAHNEFVLFFQPLIDCASLRINGLEVLLRWWHPERGMLSPADFIAVAEDTGVIVPIGEWVLRQASEQLAEWRKAGLPAVRLSVNISARQLESADFVESVLHSVELHALDCQCLELEITESLLMRDMESNAVKLSRLAAAGVQIAIDDFGTGYSSFKYLSKFPIHTLKIDQSFVQELSPNRPSPIVSAIIGMAQGLKLNVVAEGVEIAAQQEALTALGCSEMQGYLFGAPVPGWEAVRLLREAGESLASLGAIA